MAGNGATPDADTQALEETAKPESIEAFVEERKEQEQSEETGEPIKRKSRYERLKAARDQYRQEAEDLRQQLSRGLEPQAPEEEPQENQNPYEEDIDQGRREAEWSEQLAARDDQIRVQTQLAMRAEEVKQHYPDFDETIEFAKSCGYNPGPVFSDLLLRHPQGPLFAYALAKDAANGGDLLMQLESLADNPVAQAKEFGKMEATVMAAMRQGYAQPRTTRAPAPMRPISGGSAGPRDLHSLAKSDDVSSYVSARRGR